MTIVLIGLFFHFVQILENHENRSELLRAQYVQNLTAIQLDVEDEIRNASRSMWACDPNDFSAHGKH